MKKYIVLSVNDNVDYLYFAPIVNWAWQQFGWWPIVFFNGKVTPIVEYTFRFMFEEWDGTFVHTVDSIPSYRSDTITQISRLYGACLDGLSGGDYLMTGDIDMLPLSDYWKLEREMTAHIRDGSGRTKQVICVEGRPTVWGHDLTGFTHYPICYIGMNAANWAHVMKFDAPLDYNRLIKRDLDTLPQAKDPDFYKYWFSDQDLITARLKEYGTEKITFINRGQGSHGYARGRVDRGSNGWVLDQPELIDAHLQQQTHHSQEKIDRLMQLLRHVWPGEDFTWFEEYTKEFKRLAV